MTAVAVVAHLLSIVRGIGISFVCAACMYVAGIACLPRRWGKFLGDGESPAVLGAALYVLVCWFGIPRGVTLARLGVGFASVTLLLAVARHGWIASALEARGVLTRVTYGWIAAFSGLYVLAYLFTLPPATAEYLPPSWTGNIDMMTYMRYTTHLLRLGPSNLAGFSYLDWVYLQTPAVFYFLGWLSLLLGRDAMSAVMPAQFALIALTGIFVARISRSVFGISRASALTIGCILVSGPFFRYVAGAYFLSTLMATPILLYLVWQTVSYRSPRFLDGRAVIHFGSAYVLLLFMYPFLLFAGVAAQAAAIVLTLVAEGRLGNGSPAWREAGRHAARTMCGVLLPLGLLALCFFQRLAWSIDMVRSLSQAGVAGWPMDIISPLALLGLPVSSTDRSAVQDASHRIWALAAFGALALALGFLYFSRLRERTTVPQRTLVGLAGGAFLLYCAYFLRVGPSYQQWKFASYTAMPLSFVVFAGGLQWLRQSGPFTRATRTLVGRRVVATLLGVVAVGLVGGNLLVHAQSDQVLVRFSGGLRNLSTVDNLPFFHELAVQMDDSNPFGAYLALYFLPNKRVHVISSTFGPSEPLSFEPISRQRPLLMQNYGCEGVGHDDTMTIPGVGCLLFAPPSLALDTSYPFNRSFLFVQFEGLAGREGDGRWNSRSLVTFELTADLRHAWVSQDTYVNLRLKPYLPPGTPRQRVVWSWGADKHGEASLAADEWVSLPVSRADWTGDRLWKLPFAIAFPDGAAPHWVNAPDGGYQEDRPLAAVFEDLSISVEPRGRVVTTIGGPAAVEH